MNKPPADQLLQIWLRSLAGNDGLDLDGEGVTYSMVYWADVLYEKPQDTGAMNESLGSEASPEKSEEDESWRVGLEGREKEIVDRLAARLRFDAAAPQGDDEYEPRQADIGAEFERIPLPWFIKRRVMKALLKDVHHYLFNSEFSPRDGETYRVLDEIRKRFVRAVTEGNEIEQSKPDPGKHVVVSHSMGTVIAYDCLKRVPDCPEVNSLMTIGSPLGLDEVQDLLQPEWTRENGFPSERVLSSWVNVYDKLDPVAGFDPNLSNDYRQAGVEVVDDINEQNEGKWRHNISKYLSKPRLRDALENMVF
ncbi:MAG: hypothetical protein LJE91_18230 [Gammaproteobacteria bacterium]|nr:hypothetical protein [Gammaproteobacteria bacterium]